MEDKIEYKHRDLEQAIFDLACLAHIGVNDKNLINNLTADCKVGIQLYEDLKQQYAKAINTLDIIKEKKVNVSLLFNTKNYWDYNDHVSRAQIYLQSNAKCLTQEEYDLLKEVLL